MKSRTGNYVEALNVFNRCLEAKADYAVALNNKGLVLIKMGKEHWDEALSSFNQALQFEPYYEAAYLNKNRLLSLIQKKNSKHVDEETIRIN